MTCFPIFEYRSAISSIAFKADWSITFEFAKSIITKFGSSLGLNISKNLPIPIVVRFDYSGSVPHARERALADCKRVDEAIKARYSELYDQGSLHTFLTIRDRDKKSPAEVVGSSLDPALKESH